MAGNVFNEFAFEQVLREHGGGNGLGLPPLEGSSSPYEPVAGPRQPGRRGSPDAYMPLFEASAARHGVPLDVLMGMAEQESSYNPQAVGIPTQYGRARGMMQYLDSTAAGLGINPYDPAQAIDAAARQIRQRLDRGYSMQDAVREHFAGPDRRLWGPRTQRYGQEVLGRAARIAGEIRGRYEQSQPQEVQPLGQTGAAPLDAGSPDPTADPSFTGRASENLRRGMESVGRALDITRTVVGDGFTDSSIGHLADSIVAGAAENERARSRRDPQETNLEQALQEFGQTEGFWGTLGGLGRLGWAAVTNPRGLALGVIEQAPNSLPTLAGAVGGAATGAGIGAGIGAAFGGAGAGPGALSGSAWGARVGGASGTAIAEFGNEVQQAVTDRLRRDNRQVTRENVVALLRDPAFQTEMTRQAATKGVTLAAVDAVFAGLGERILRGPRTAVGGAVAHGNITPRRAAAAFGTELVSEPAGEAASQLAARGEIDKADVAAEGLYGTGQAVAQTAISSATSGAARAARRAVAPGTLPPPPAGGAGGTPPAAGAGAAPPPAAPPPAAAAPPPAPPPGAPPSGPAAPGTTAPAGSVDPTEPPTPGPLSRAMASQTATTANAGTAVIVESDALGQVEGVVEYETPQGVMVRTAEGPFLVPFDDLRSGAIRLTPVGAPAAPAAATQAAPVEPPAAPPPVAPPPAAASSQPAAPAAPAAPPSHYEEAVAGALEALAHPTPDDAEERAAIAGEPTRIPDATQPWDTGLPDFGAPSSANAAPAGDWPGPAEPAAPSTAQAPATNAKPEAEIAPAVGMPPAAPASAATTFRTAKGSSYVVHEDGTTTRDKAFRPEHGKAEQGPQPRSERTFYVTRDDANKLGEIQARGGSSKTIQVYGDHAGMRYEEGKNAGKVETRTYVPIQTAPAVGLVPVELWDGGSRVHFGNPITEVGAPATAAKQAPAAPKPGTPAQRQEIARLEREMLQIADEWDKIGEHAKAARTRESVPRMVANGVISEAIVRKHRAAVEAEKAFRAKQKPAAAPTPPTAAAPAASDTRTPPTEPAPEPPGTPPPTATLEDRIKDAVRASPDYWGSARLADVRERLPDVPRAELDKKLVEMASAGRISMSPFTIQMDRTPRDEAAQLKMGPFKRDLISRNPASEDGETLAAKPPAPKAAEKPAQNITTKDRAIEDAEDREFDVLDKMAWTSGAVGQAHKAAVERMNAARAAYNAYYDRIVEANGGRFAPSRGDDVILQRLMDELDAAKAEYEAATDRLHREGPGNMLREWSAAQGTKKVGQTPAAGIEAPKAEEKPAAAAPAPEEKPASKPAVTPSGNTVFTDDAAEAARKLIRARLAGSQLNSGIDPELLQAGLTLAGWHIEKGARTFAAYSKAMLADMGEIVRPYLKSWYLGVKFDPRATSFEGMSSAAEVEAADIAVEGDSTDGRPGVRTPGGEAVPGNEPRPGDDAQQGTAPANPANLGAGQPEDVGKSDQARGGEQDGVRLPGADVAAEGAAPAGRNGGDRRARAGRKGQPDARTGDAGDPGGRGAVEPPTSAEVVAAANEQAPAQPQSADFHMDNPLDIVGGGPVARFDRNRQAIELYHAITEQGRPATADEQRVLAGYTGWGSFGQELFQGTWDKPMPKKGWEARDQWLRSHLGRKDWESAQRSITNAHYTDPPTVMAMWEMVRRMGFKGGRVLEPSMGIGNFFSMMPADLKARSRLSGIEMDSLTGGMAKLLFPQSDVRVMPYQDSKTPDGFYDIVIGNWPFENTTIADRRYNALSPQLHDYFFLKAVDQTRPGGLVIGITSAGTMDKVSPRVRGALARKAELVTSIRLPSGAFEEYAGTKVVTDIIILQRRDADMQALPEGTNWLESVKVQTPAGTPVRVNQFYAENPANIIGTLDYGHGTTTYGAGMIVHRPADMANRLKQAAASVPENAYRADQRTKHITYVTNNTTDREGSVTLQDGGLHVVRGSQLAAARDVLDWAKGVKPETAATREAQIRDLIGMRRALAPVLDADRQGEDATAARARLKSLFDAFREKHGPIQDSYGWNYLDRVRDPFAPSLAALEVNGKPAAILTRSTMRAVPRMVNPSVSDAWIIARTAAVQPSLAEVARIAERPEAEVEAELLDSGVAFKAPNGDIVPADVYLSGNVREKLRQALAARDEKIPGMDRNIAALEKAVPPDIPYFNIEVQLGATWVSPETYRAYVAHMLNMTEAEAAEVEVAFKTNGWHVSLPAGANSRNEAFTGYGTPAYRFSNIVSAAFANQTVVVREKDSDGNEYVDKDRTEKANAAVAKIREDFGDWLWSDPERRVELEKAYNEARNAYADPSFDGSFLPMPGMALTLGTGQFNLRKHQKDAIWRALVNRRSLNAHEVGTGKTFTLAGIAIESRRYGIARKPMILAHNANSASVASDINRMYPGAKVLYVDNLTPAEINIRLRQIANDDWDAVVLPHSLIDRMALSEKTLNEMAREEIANLEAEAMAAIADAGEKFTLADMEDEDKVKKLRNPTAKELVKTRNKLKEAIKKMAQRASRDGAIPFDELGVDMVLVDEAHEFKKPPFATRMNMKGLQRQTSDRSIALQFLTRFIGDRANGNVHLFTGTPVTNTLTEVFHMMRYIMQRDMKTVGVDTWDGWFGSFAREVNDVELSAAGEYEPVSRLAAFINVPELRRMVGQYMDVVFSDDMPEMQPRRTKTGKTMASTDLTEAERAELLNGRTEGAADRPYKKVINETADLTPEQSRIFQVLQGYAREWREMRGLERRQAMAEGDPRSPIITEGLASKASYDVRLMDEKTFAGQEGRTNDDPSSKASRVVRNVLEIYRSHPQANQVIFAETGFSTSTSRTVGRSGDGKAVKGTVKTFSTIKDIRARLIAGGIPATQIEVVTGATSKERRKEIADAMNAGTVRVVIGSTDTLGVGVNMQANLRAMHHMDAPYMPGDLEQRNGRGQRQGNAWNTVLEYRYMTDRLDGRRWQILATKQRFITAFLKAKDDKVRVIEGDAASDEQSDIMQSFGEAAGDPRVLLKEKEKRAVERLQRRERAYSQGVADAKHQTKSLTEQVERRRGEIRQIERDGTVSVVSGILAANRGDGFRARINGKDYAKRSEAEAALAAWAKESLRLGTEGRAVAGEYGGAPISGSWPKWSDMPLFRLGAGGQEFSFNGTFASLDARLRGYPAVVQDMRDSLASAEASLERAKEVAAAPFAQADALKKAQARLKALEDDMAANPVPPPAWLRQGAPVETAVFWNGKEFVVSGHRWSKTNWFVLAQDAKGEVLIPYTEARAAQGMPVYEERPFVPPVVEKEAALPAADDTRLSVASAHPEPSALRPGVEAELRAILTRMLGREAMLQVGDTGAAEGIAAGPLIRLSMSLGEDRARWVAQHEAIHTLRNLGRITPTEWGILIKAATAGDWMARFNIDTRYSTLPIESQMEEAIAEGFAEWATGGMDAKGPVARIFQKIAAFLQRLRNALAGRGFKDMSSVFQDIEAGRMAQRPVGSAAPPRSSETAEQASDRLDRRVAVGRLSVGDDGQLRLALPAAAQKVLDGKIATFVRDIVSNAVPTVLGMAPLRPLLDEVAKAYGVASGAKFLRTKQAMDALRDQWFATAAEVTNKWLGYRTRNKAENAELMDLMHATTQAEYDPSTTDAANVATLNATQRALYDRYQALSDEGKAIYQEVRDTYTKMADAFDEALLANVSGAVSARAREAERAHKKEMARIASSGMTQAEQNTARQDADKILAREKEIVRLTRAGRLHKLRVKFESNRIKGPYFPLARFGKYFVTARNAAGEVVSFSLFEKLSQQTAMRKEMEAAGHQVSYGRVEGKDGLRSQVDPRFVADVESLLEKANAPADLQDQIWQRYLQRLPDLSVRMSKIHRKGTAGFNTDAVRAFAHHLFHGSHQLARLNYAMELQDHVANARQEAEESRNPNAATAVVDEMSKAVDFIMNPTSGKIAHRLSTAAFIYQLSASPAAAAVNLSQTWMVGIPLLATEPGGSTVKAAGALMRAAKDVTRTFSLKEWRNGLVTAERAPSLTNEERAAIRQGYVIGLFDRTMAHDQAGVAESGVEYNATRHKIMSVMSYLYHHTERVNREATFLAAYRLARERKLSHEEAIEDANRLTLKIHFDMQNTSRPRLLRHDAVKIATIFKSYVVNMLFRLFWGLHQMTMGETKEIRREAKHQLVGMSMMMMAAAGISGTWGYGIIMMMAGLFFGKPGDDEEDKLRKWMQANLGVGLTGILMDGIPGWGLGISLSERIGMPDLWLRSSDRDLEGRDAYWYGVEQVLGPIIGLGKNIYLGGERFWTAIRSETGGWRDMYKGVETAAPKAIRDIMRAGRFGVDGATNQRGEPLMESVSWGEIFRQALGFTPARLAQVYAENNALQNYQRAMTEERGKLLAAYYRASRADDTREMQRLEGIMDRFSEEHPVYAISPQQRAQSMRSRERRSEQTVNGVYLPPRRAEDARSRLPAPTY